MGFSRQEYWCGLPFPSPGDLPNPGIEPRSPALQADALTSEPPGEKKQRTLQFSVIKVYGRYKVAWRRNNYLYLANQGTLSLFQNVCTYCSLVLSYFFPQTYSWIAVPPKPIFCSKFPLYWRFLLLAHLSLIVLHFFCFKFASSYYIFSYYLSSACPLDVISQESRNFFPVDHKISNTSSVSWEYLLNAKWLNERLVS